MEAEVARVFKMASAYFRVAATKSPPAAAMNVISQVLIVHPFKKPVERK